MANLSKTAWTKLAYQAQLQSGHVSVADLAVQTGYSENYVFQKLTWLRDKIGLAIQIHGGGSTRVSDEALADWVIQLNKKMVDAATDDETADETADD